MLFSNIIRKAGNQGGFSLGEVIIATALFMTAVVGVGGMLVAGTAGVSRTAQANKAEKLAMQKIEEVRNLPFYTPWEESGQDTDIDDFYYNEGYANDQQFAHPSEENPISGNVGYRRTTAVQFVYVGGSKLEYATMDPTWVSNNPNPPTTIDKPKGGPAGGPYDYLHGIMIEVRVYYMLNGVEKSVVQHALAGDLVTPGGEGNLDPILIAERIVPGSGYIGDVAVDCTITVTAPELKVTDTVEVSLWRAGSTDINATNVVVTAAGGPITCRFNLQTPVPDAGIYHLAVNWVNRGFLDNNLHNCFEILAHPPTIDYVYTVGEAAGTAWGYSGQNARTVYISGTYLQACTATLKKSGETSLAGSSYSSNPGGTLAQANFNMTGAVTGDWDMEVTNGVGGDTDSGCFEQNPLPTIASINQGGSYFSWGYRDLAGSRLVQINGTYLYGLNSAPGTSDLTRAGLSDCNAASYTYAASGNGISSANCTYARVNFDLSGTPDQRPNNTKWKVFVRNGGNRTAQMDGVWDGVGPDYAFQMNPPPVVSNITSWPGSSYTGSKVSNSLSGIAISGKYIQSGATEYIVQTGGAHDPATNDVYVQLSGGTVAADGSGVSGLSARVYVNPLNNSFKLWGSGTAPTNAQIGPSGASPNNYGRYYIYLVNADGQSAPVPAVTRDITHKQYSISATSSPAGWGSVTGAGSKWQDESYSLSPNPVSSSGNWLGALRVWQEPPGTDQWGYPYTIAGEATADRSLNCRFSKWFYHGDYGASSNWASFVGYQIAQHTSWQPLRDEGGYRVMLVQSTADDHWSFLSHYYHEGRLGARTNNQVNYSGATTLYFYGMNDSGDFNGADNWCSMCSSTGATDGWSTGRMWYNSGSDEFGWGWRSVSVSGRATGYLHFNTETDYSILGGRATNFRIRYCFME